MQVQLSNFSSAVNTPKTSTEKVESKDLNVQDVAIATVSGLAALTGLYFINQSGVVGAMKDRVTDFLGYSKPVVAAPDYTYHYVALAVLGFLATAGGCAKTKACGLTKYCHRTAVVQAPISGGSGASVSTSPSTATTQPTQTASHK